MTLASAVFLDRDGVVSDVVFREGEPASPRSLDEFHLRDEAPPAVRRLRAAGFRTFVVTNQPDVSRGRLTEACLAQMMELVKRDLDVHDCRVCPHDDADACDCRKPRPGMIHALAERWNVDLAASYLVGDSWKDVEAGRAAGCRTILLARDYNRDVRADLVAPDLDAAVDLILRGANA